MNSEIKAADPNNITTTTEGGYLVPDQTAAEIIGLIPTFGQLRPLVDVGRFPMNISSLKVPKRGTGLTVYYPGENGSITSTKLTLDLITLVSKKAAGLAVLTDELKAFAIVDFVNYIKERAAEGFGLDEDTQGMGVGNSTFTGLFYGSNAYGYTDTSDFTDITYEQLLEMIYGLDQKYLVNGKWLAHRTVVSALRKIKDNDNKPLLVEANAGGLPTMMGYPVVTAEKAPALTSLVSGNAGLILGNFKNSMIKDRQGMRIDMSTEAVVDATSMFQNDLTAIRFIREWSFHPGLVEGYAALKKA
jgi:HK97 family phage major capsid protein